MASVALLPNFRPIGAAGNNLQNPALNPTPGTPETRIAAPGTTNGLINGPNPRTISNVVSGGAQGNVNDPTHSDWLYVFGQFVDHDLSSQQIGTTPINIPIPPGDPNFPAGSSIALNRAVIDPTNGTSSVRLKVEQFQLIMRVGVVCDLLDARECLLQRQFLEKR
jgi:peroxidase